MCDFLDCFDLLDFLDLFVGRDLVDLIDLAGVFEPDSTVLGTLL